MTQKNIAYCILDSNPSFVPIEYHACSDDTESYDKNLFEFIGTGLIFRVSDKIYSTMIYKNFYIRRE